MIDAGVASYLGLARRASKLISGESQVLGAIRSSKAKSVVLATDTGAASTKKITDKCKYYQIKLFHYGTSAELSAAIGQQRNVIAIMDDGFAARLQEKINRSVK